MTSRFGVRTARNGAAVLTAGLLLGVVPGLVAGGAAHASAATTVAISSPAVVRAGQTFSIDVHTNLPSGKITFYQSVAGQARRAIVSRDVDVNGNTSISGTSSATVTFTARHEDDGVYGAAEKSTTTKVQQGLKLKTKGGKKKAGYRLYKVNKKAKFTVKVSPAKIGSKIKFRVQKLVGSRWKPLGTRKLTIKRGSKAKLVFTGKTHHSTYRVRAEWKGDRLNSANKTAWSVIVYK